MRCAVRCRRSVGTIAHRTAHRSYFFLMTNAAPDAGGRGRPRSLYAWYTYLGVENDGTVPEMLPVERRKLTDAAISPGVTMPDVETTPVDISCQSWVQAPIGFWSLKIAGMRW